MINPRGLTKYVGFTEDEVEELCRESSMDFTEAKHWYDGYFFQRKIHIYNPRSIIQAMMNGEFENYWTQTETYEGLKSYIDLNYEGLKDDIVFMIGGGRCEIDTGTFQNDMTSFRSKDDILTLLVHLGYLAYDKYCKEVYIPNEEIKEEFIRVVKNSDTILYQNASPAKYLAGIYDQISQSVSCGQEFSDDHANQAKADIHLHIADDCRDGAWKHHL